MGTANGPANRSDLDVVADTRRDIEEMTDAWTRRHRLEPGTLDYAAALETEERLASRIWGRLRANSSPVWPPPTGD